MNRHPDTFTLLVCSIIDDVLLKAMPAIMSDRSRYEFLLDRLAAEFLCKFCSSMGSDLDVGATGLMK